MALGRLASRAVLLRSLPLGRSARSSLSRESLTREEPQSRIRARVSIRTVKPRLVGSPDKPIPVAPGCGVCPEAGQSGGGTCGLCPASEAAADGAARIGFVLLGPPIPKGRARTAAAFPRPRSRGRTGRAICRGWRAGGSGSRLPPVGGSTGPGLIGSQQGASALLSIPSSPALGPTDSSTDSGVQICRESRRESAPAGHTIVADLEGNSLSL